MAAIQVDAHSQVLLEDPYVSLGLLGQGSYGFVDKVEKKSSPGAVFARKTVRISGAYQEINLQTANNEARILHRLNHRHVVRILEVYTYQNNLSIIMLQVADCNMREYLKNLDDMANNEERDARRMTMQMWPGCLIQAIDYLHEMRIKHKDLKPENILIKDGQVLIADFGISKDLIDEETTATLHMRQQGTLMYWAPEVDANNRRGRATDIFSLGCIFLEIATVLVAPPGSLRHFSDFREINGSRAYCRCPMKLVQWIWFMWGIWHEYLLAKQRRKVKYDEFLEHGPAVYDLAFLMLDPDPKTRITSRQLVAMAHAQESYFRGSIKELACENCGGGSVVKQNNLPLHSVYKHLEHLTHPSPPELALGSIAVASNWEGVKRMWLKDHMWWDPN